MTRTWGILLWMLVLAAAVSLAARLVPFTRAEGEAGLRLSEILAGPARDWDGNGTYDARQDEWLEVTNAGPSILDLSDYRLADADSTIRYELSGALEPEGVLLITGAMAEEHQRALGRTVTGLSLNNSGDTIFIFRVGNGDTVRVDGRRYNSIEGASDRSTGWLSDPATWVLFDAFNKYSGAGEPKGTGCPPTPGARNGCTTGVTGTTWGKIKQLFLEAR